MRKSNQNQFENLLTEKIYDDIHGFVYLTKAEKNLLQNPYLQRLHHLKQNGLAYMVFPGANHTRFSHSIGVLYIAEKMLRQLEKTKKLDINIIDHQVIRLSALLHDIGHYPLSHTIEASYQEFFTEENNKEKLVSQEQTKDNSIFKISNFLDFHTYKKPNDDFHHEYIGKKIITKSTLQEDIKKILRTVNVQEGELDFYIQLIGNIIIGKIFLQDNIDEVTKEKYNILSQIIKSNLDADQLDYMLRDTHNTGIESSIRLDFIIDNMNICKKKFGKKEKGMGSIVKKVLCFNAKALKSIEQFIISKFYWYTEILFYEKAHILNCIAQKLNTFMLSLKNKEKYENKYNTKEEFEKLIFSPNEYFFFNDIFFWNKIEHLIKSKNEGIKEIKKLANILMTNNVPTLLTKKDINNETGIKDIKIDSFYGTISPKDKFYDEILKKDYLVPIQVTRDIFRTGKSEDNDEINISFCDSNKYCTKICRKTLYCKNITDIKNETILNFFMDKKNTQRIIKRMVFKFDIEN